MHHDNTVTAISSVVVVLIVVVYTGLNWEITVEDRKSITLRQNVRESLDGVLCMCNEEN